MDRARLLLTSSLISSTVISRMRLRPSDSDASGLRFTRPSRISFLRGPSRALSGEPLANLRNQQQPGPYRRCLSEKFLSAEKRNVFVCSTAILRFSMRSVISRPLMSSELFRSRWDAPTPLMKGQ